MFGEVPEEHVFNENTLNEMDFNEHLDVNFTESELRKVIFR